MKKLKFKRSKSETPADTAPTVDAVHSAAVPAVAAGPKLPSAWQLAVRSWRDYANYWWFYCLVVALVMVPLNLVSLFGHLGEDASFQSYAAVATIFMNTALLYLIVQLGAGRGLVGLRTAYYDGSAAALRFIVVSVALAVMIIPAVLGMTVLALGYTSVTAAVALGEKLLIGGLGLILIVPSIWWLARFAFSLVIVVAEGARPMAALKRSRQLTLGRFWPVFGRLIIMLLLLVLLAVAVYIPVGLLGMVAKGQANLLLAIYQLVVSLTLLPLATLYMFKLYRDLVRVPAKA